MSFIVKKHAAPGKEAIQTLRSCVPHECFSSIGFFMLLTISTSITQLMCKTEHIPVAFLYHAQSDLQSTVP
jgi:hypothetical protein